MEIKNIFGRNLGITHEIRERFEKLESYFIFRGRDTKNIFMLCLALGYAKGTKTDIKGSASGLVNTASFEDEDLFAIAAIAVADSKDMMTMNNGPLMRKIALQYVGTGLDVLEQLAAEYRSGDNLELAIEEIARKTLKASD
jgi:hypothetical protein